MTASNESGGPPATSVEWRLTDALRQLDANLVRLRPGASITEHVEADLDVLVCVTAGSGRLDADGRATELAPGGLAWLPRGTARAVTAGPDGLSYLTVHRRRPGLAVRGLTARAEPEPSPPPSPSPAPRPEGGEPVCLLHRVCTECGRFAEERDARYCARCGTPLPSE
ncbi:cupin domain-containing protein [Streptomyces sp. 4N509B]|uniref:cupin domain-containing protein n=1 Tax=Streptomyces sp. 4N509B TaxID=3457413 RepID=UPI003FD1C150